MTFVRSIGRWTMTALVINCIISGAYSVCLHACSDEPARLAPIDGATGRLTSNVKTKANRPDSEFLAAELALTIGNLRLPQFDGISLRVMQMSEAPRGISWIELDLDSRRS